MFGILTTVGTTRKWGLKWLYGMNILVCTTIRLCFLFQDDWSLTRLFDDHDPTAANVRYHDGDPRYAGDPTTAHHHDREEVATTTGTIRYHEWGPEGIEVDGLIHFFRNRLFNNYAYRSELHLKNRGLFSGKHEFVQLNAAFLAIVAVRENDTVPNLYFSPAVVCRTSLKGNRLFPHVLPQFQEALSVDLLREKNRLDYPSLVSALEEGGSIPLLFQTSDWKTCSNRSYEYTGLDGSTKTGSVPRLCFSRILGCGYNFPIPDYNLVKSAVQGSRRFITANNTTTRSWESKIPRALWRGQLTHWARKDLVRLASSSNNNSNISRDLFDVKAGKEHFVPYAIFANYRAVLDIDGHAWTDRFYDLLCLDVVVIKIAIDCTSYFAPSLIPGVHYLPASLENLTRVVEHATNDDNAGEMKAIVSNANEWCRQINPERVRNDMLSILNGYAEELYRADKNWTSTWNHYSKEVLVGERAWNATGGWMSKFRCGRKGPQPRTDEIDFVVSRLPKK